MAAVVMESLPGALPGAVRPGTVGVARKAGRG